MVRKRNQHSLSLSFSFTPIWRTYLSGFKAWLSYNVLLALAFAVAENRVFNLEERNIIVLKPLMSNFLEEVFFLQYIGYAEAFEHILGFSVPSSISFCLL